MNQNKFRISSPPHRHGEFERTRRMSSTLRLRPSTLYPLASSRPGKSRYPGADTPARQQQTRASTLTEVLVALMITSIGLVSVATLFPLSILRSVKATQLTSATDVRFNAEAAIDMYPNMLPISPQVPPVINARNPRPNVTGSGRIFESGNSFDVGPAADAKLRH